MKFPLVDLSAELKSPLSFDLTQGLDVAFAEGATVTVATVSTLNGDFEATGEAKRCPGDEDDSEIGRTLALGRALESLSELLIGFAIARGFQR